MIIGGYTMDDDGVHGVTVKEIEAGWSFCLQGDDAQQFRKEWKQAQAYNISFGRFLWVNEYTQLFQ